MVNRIYLIIYHKIYLITSFSSLKYQAIDSVDLYFIKIFLVLLLLTYLQYLPSQRSFYSIRNLKKEEFNTLKTAGKVIKWILCFSPVLLMTFSKK